jgi:hypothetical protein
MEKRLALCPGGEQQFVELMDDFFGFEPDGSPKPPAVQAVVNAVKARGGWGGDIHGAGEAMHTFEGLCNGTPRRARPHPPRTRNTPPPPPWRRRGGAPPRPVCRAATAP